MKYWRLSEMGTDIAAMKLKQIFKQELKNMTIHEVESCLDYSSHCDFDFYRKEQKPVSFWIRLTLPLALVVIVLAFVLLPVNFLITGYWGYKFVWLKNWFRSLRF